MSRPAQSPESGPPPPPQSARRILVSPSQAAGLAVLFAIPVLAAFGLFGVKPVAHEVSAGGFVLSAENSPKNHLGHTTQLNASVRRADGAPVGRVRLHVDTDYLGGFSQLALAPMPVDVSARAYSFGLQGTSEHPAPRVVIDMVPEKPGRNRGRLTAVVDGGPTLELTLAGIIFP